MTTIVMIEQDDNVFIGFDSRMSGGNNKIESPNHKVFTNNGNIYGVAGSSAFLNAIAYADLPKMTVDYQAQEERFVTNALIPAIRKTLAKAEPGTTDHDIMIFAVVNGKVFEISGTLGWTRSSSRQYAIGSGSYYALGAMSAGASAWQAVIIAAEHDHHTGDTFRAITASELLAQ